MTKSDRPAPTDDKRSFYSRSEVAAAYDEQRFGGASGARVNAREVALALDLVPADTRVIDLACGTGRIAAALAARGQPVVGLDYSPPMAERTAALGVAAVLADAFGTPFGDAAFGAAVAVRFAFHYPDLAPLLREMRRLVAPGGHLVFDTYSWSPRAAFALGARRWGSRVHLHSRQRVAEVAARHRLRIERIEPCFLFSPYLYRLAPLPLVRLFESLEPRVPNAWLCRVFWRLRVEPAGHDASPL